MDQLKVVLGWIKAQHFWLLIVLAIAVGLGGWYQGASQLAADTKSNQQKIDAEFKSTESIGGKYFHPNDNVNASQKVQNRLLADEVRELWQKLYQRQVKEALIWPRQLRSDFAPEVSKLTFGEDILPYLRDDYLNYIQKRFPDLPKIIDALEVQGEGGPRRSSRGFGGEFGGMAGEFGGMGGGVRMDEETLASADFLVLWHDQDLVRQQLNWDKRPSSLAIWVTQEDLWIYETLLKAIAATNQASGADRYSNAAVREIYAMQVGRDAAKKNAGSRIFVPQAESAGGMGGEFGGMAGEFGGMGGDFGGGEFGGGGDLGGDFGGMGGEFGGMGGEYGAGGEADEKTTLLAGRYVDENGQPMAAPLDEGFRFGTEYKRLPVRLVLKMDQRWLPKLITELANAPLQVEVQEVRINPTEEFGGGMRGGSRGGFSEFGGGRGAGNDSVLAFDREPQVREQVVIEGLVYIFYPPDEATLAVPTEGADLAADF